MPLHVNGSSGAQNIMRTFRHVNGPWAGVELTKILMAAATTFTCAVCLVDQPLAMGRQMACSADHGPCLCNGDCFNGWVVRNPSCPVCRQSWKDELPDGRVFAQIARVTAAFDAEIDDIDAAEYQAFQMLQRGDDRLYQLRDFNLERTQVVERKYRAIAAALQGTPAHAHRPRSRSRSRSSPARSPRERRHGRARRDAANPYQRVASSATSALVTIVIQ
jgi:hypothetical protein